MKIRCRKCLEFLDESLFSEDGRICDICLEEDQPEKFVHTVGFSAQKQRKRLGLRQVDYDNIYSAQKGKCAICGIHQSEESRSFHVDHDHNDGQIRGLLCGNCNAGLGFFKDNRENLINAVVYLSNTRKLKAEQECCR